MENRRGTIHLCPLDQTHESILADYSCNKANLMIFLYTPCIYLQQSISCTRKTPLSLRQRRIKSRFKKKLIGILTAEPRAIITLESLECFFELVITNAAINVVQQSLFGIIKEFVMLYIIPDVVSQ